MARRTDRPWVRVALAAAVFAGTAVVVFGVLSPPERCPSVEAAELRRSATETVDWFTRNQQPDGTWLYLYDADSDTAAAAYNVVRHMGAGMGLYQAASEGIPGALAVADRGTAWALDRLVERDDWAAPRYQGEVSSGAAALLVAGLAERRAATGDDRHDELLAQLGWFLLGQTEPSGAVLAFYDLGAGRPVPGAYSKYYTGETYWALARLHRLFPGGPWGDAASRIGSYLATRRDVDEDLWPPIPDHWAAYGLAETVAFEDRGDGQPLTDAELAYARRQAGLFGSQVRWVSQRFGPWGVVVRGPHVPRGGGYGVVGEGLTGLWRVAEADPRLADLRAPLAERATCIAGLAVREQSDPVEANDSVAPARVRGAWFRDGETRMDDQQHALSALLRTVAIVDAAAAGDSATGGTGSVVPSRPAPSAWLWLVALVAVANSCRVALGVPRRDRSRRDIAVVAALGGVAGGLVVYLVSLASGPLLDAFDVSAPAFRIAAGAVGAIAGAVALVRPAPPPEPALRGRGAALVPVAVPLVAGPALVVLALSAHADRGAGVVALALAIAVGLFAIVATRVGVDGVSGRTLRWATRATAAAAVVAAVLLVVDGIFAV
ncbi:MAG TPA: MarC family protein [Acidimicrobiales bacterium]|nr:MarC family protein [Acidimicrobiales bacterium]